MKRKVSLFLTFILTLSMFFSVNVNVFAANYPSISSSKYIEFKAQQNINVYKDTSCKTRGTSSPSKKYNASISSGDTCYIYEIEKNYLKINYPTSSGRRTGYIKRSALFDKTAPTEYISSSKAKVTVHKSSSGSYIAKGDKVWAVDTKKEFSEYKAVIYEAKSGNRAYKMGYVTSNDFGKIKSGTSSKTNSTAVKQNTSASKNGAMIIHVTSQTELWKDLLNDKKKAAKSVIDVVNTVNIRTAVMEVVGTSSIAVATWNPAKLLGVLSEDSAIGLTSCLVTEQYFQEAEKAHEKFNSLTKKISTDKEAIAAFEAFVEALSKYNAVIEANIDTVKRYTEKDNYRKDMLTAYLSSVAAASIPASEFDAIINAFEKANTVNDMIDVVGSKYAGYKAMVETRNKWYASCNEFM